MRKQPATSSIAPEAALPFVSVVIPTAGRPDLLAQCLECLAGQDYPADRYEVIVVENGVARDAGDLGAIAPANGVTIRKLTRAERDANTARNLGISAAAGDPIVLLDDDSMAPPSWLRALVEGAIRNPDAGCLGGPVNPRYVSPPPRTCDAHELAGACLDEGPDEREIHEVWGCNMAVRRFALARAGPFREGLRFSQEWEWQHRLRLHGVPIVYVPDAGLDHLRHGSDLRLPPLLRQHAWRGWFIAGELRRTHELGRGAARRALVRSGRRLAHGLTAGCSRGLTDSAREAGWAARLLFTRRG
jgi:GT2 family glycosyltransferase